MERYKYLGETIPREDRKSLNEHILALIRGGSSEVTQEEIYNAYTGNGGLHGLSFSDYQNFHEYTKDKQSTEQGQFFTPHEICKKVYNMVSPNPQDTICDPTCGIGTFFNFHTPDRCFGNDIDSDATLVASYLFPEAKIQNSNLIGYKVEPVDYIFGNPPFNLRWHITGIGDIYSQDYFFFKCADLIKPSGVLAVVVPDNFLSDDFTHKTSINRINESYSFIGQFPLKSDTFKALGVGNYKTKVLFLQRTSEHFPHNPYELGYTSEEVIMDRLSNIKAKRKDLGVKLRREMLEKFDSDFLYKVKKYLYEIKTHKELNDYIALSNDLLERFNTQKCPPDMDYTEWSKTSMITEAKVLRQLKRYISKQDKKPQIDVIELVKTNYTFKLKGYSNKLSRKINSPTFKGVREISINDLVIGTRTIAEFDCTFPKGLYKLLNRKIKAHKIQTTPFESMCRDEAIDKELKRFSFRNGLGERSKLNDKQVHDLGLMVQKNYGILNWQMGSGKTVSGFYWLATKKAKIKFILSTSLSINNTWKKFLTQYGAKFVIINKLKDFDKIDSGTYVLLSFYYLKKYRKHLKNLIRKSGHNVGLLFDESDEITDPNSNSTKVTQDLFRRARFSLLTTGTTTRNNIAEMYPQLELIYNNSFMMIDNCAIVYKERKDFETKETKVVPMNNQNYGNPYKARLGNGQFKSCFNPSKTTVFGVGKQDQKVYNMDVLREIIGYTIITRKFKEIAGDKYIVDNVTITQNHNEKKIYKQVINEFSKIAGFFFESTGNERKDRMLDIVRQIQLLIKATSTPQYFPNYDGGVPNKAVKIVELLEEHQDEKIAVGCTSLDAVEYYIDYLTSKFPDRPIFEITGGNSVKKRGGLTSNFEKTTNGILVCTQQSLKSSLNIPSCNRVIIESLQWNIPRIEQFYFRFIRYDSKDKTKVTFLTYENTIEVNLLALLMAKERLNDFIKTSEFKEESEVFEEYGIDTDILNQLLTKEKDENGRSRLKWN